MQLWPIVLWPKPRARQHTNIHLQFATRSTKLKLLQIFLINVLLLQITVTTKGVMVAGSATHYGNYAGVDAVSAVTGLSNGYATRNYIKYYNQQSAEASAKNQQQQQQLHIENGDREQQNNPILGSHGFMGLPSHNYGNSIVARGQGAQIFHDVHDTGLMPTTFTAAGQHYATASLDGLQAITDTNNAHPHTMATMTMAPNMNKASNNIDLEQQQHQQYGHDNKAHQSMFERLSNYGDPNDNGDATKNRYDAEDVGLENYALAYTEGEQQSIAAGAREAAAPAREQFYYKHKTQNDNEQQQQQNFAKAPTYEMENQQKYNTLNNYRQTEPHLQHQSQQEVERNNFYNRPSSVEEQTYKLQALAAITQAPPATIFYQSFRKQNNNKNNVNKKQQHQQQHQHHEIVVNNNYQLGNLKQQQNQISANYHIKQLAKQQQQQLHDRLQLQQQEPEMAETSHHHTAYVKKQHKAKTESKSKRSDISEISNDLYDTDAEVSQIQLQQLQQLQDQLQQQQQQFVNLQHQLIDHDQQLQIQKHQVLQQHQNPPTLPPITHSIHHNPLSLQALAGTPLSKHTQIIKTIPVHQHHSVLVPFKHNVSIEVPDPIITTINKPIPIEIPITRTIAIPNIQEVKIPIEKILPYPVERPIPYIVEKRVPYAVEKQIAKPVYYNVPIKVPVVHTVIHKRHKPHGHFIEEHIGGHDSYREPPAHHHHHRYRSYHLPHSVHKRLSSHGHRHGYHGGHSRYGRYI